MPLYMRKNARSDTFDNRYSGFSKPMIKNIALEIVNQDHFSKNIYSVIDTSRPEYGMNTGEILEVIGDKYQEI